VVNSLQEAATEESGKETDAFRDEVLAKLAAIEDRLPPAQSASADGRANTATPPLTNA
jgi:hypothetical protein